jgi:hypothetical protein
MRLKKDVKWCANAIEVVAIFPNDEAIVHPAQDQQIGSIRHQRADAPVCWQPLRASARD